MTSEPIVIMPDENPQLSDDVDPERLLIEIVQGLLMAHARLDHVEASLRQTIESSSREHFSSLDKRLQDVDIRTQKTTIDSGKAVESLLASQSRMTRSEHAKQDENWDKLRIFLEGWPLQLIRGNKEIVSQVTSKSTALSENLSAAQTHILGRVTQEAEANRRLLVWLIALSSLSLLLLVCVAFRVFAH